MYVDKKKQIKIHLSQWEYFTNLQTPELFGHGSNASRSWKLH